MNYLFQFALIAIITFIGEILNFLIPLPIPASIYGLIILFIALCTKRIRLNQVEKAADFFLTIMPVLFVPPAVGLMTKWPILKDSLAGLLITCLLSTIIVMAVTGVIAQTLISRSKQTAGSADDADKALSSGQLHSAEIASREILYTEGADSDDADELFDLKSKARKTTHKKENI